MSEILFVRHGQASLLKTYYDDLSDQGREQATGLGRFLAEHEWTFDAVVSGPARRHLDTANAIGKAVAQQQQQPWPELETLAGLDEHDNLSLVRASVGSLSDDAEVVALRREMLEASGREERSERFGRLFEAVVIRWLQGDFEPQGVETWTQFRARVLSCIEAMTAVEPARRVLVISSLGPLAVLLQRALELDDAAAFRLAWRARNTSLSTFGFDARGRLSLDAFNALPHMPDRETWTLR